VLVLHMPDVTHQAAVARDADPSHLAGMGSDIAHALVGLVILVSILVLNIYKPKGVTRYGWRRLQAARQPSRTPDQGVGRGGEQG
jgi:hypothetical protein